MNVHINVHINVHTNVHTKVHKNVHIDNHVVKLHSDLRFLTQLQLVGVGVDFVFPLEKGRKEDGRRRRGTLTYLLA